MTWGTPERGRAVCINVLSVDQDFNFSVVDALVAPVALLKRRQQKSLRRAHRFFQARTSSKTGTLSLTTSTVRVPPRPGNWPILAVRCAQERLKHASKNLLLVVWTRTRAPTSWFSFLCFKSTLSSFPLTRWRKGEKKDLMGAEIYYVFITGNWHLM